MCPVWAHSHYLESLCNCGCACPGFSPRHKWPDIHLQLGQTRTVFYMISVGELCHLHPWNEHVFYSFKTLLTSEVQISDPPKIHELDSNQISELADVSGKLSATHGIVAANISSLHPEFFQIALPTLHVAMAGVPQALLSLFIIIVEDIWLSIYYFCACSLLASSVYMITGFVVFLAL